MKYLSTILQPAQLGFLALLVGAGLLIALFVLDILHFYIVASPSMEPVLPVGSLILVRKAKTYNPKDIITFAYPYKGTTEFVTHRIRSVETQDGVTTFTTQGEANLIQDQAEVAVDQVVGKVTLHLPYLGYLVALLQKVGSELPFTKARLLAQASSSENTVSIHAGSIVLNTEISYPVPAGSNFLSFKYNFLSQDVAGFDEPGLVVSLDGVERYQVWASEVNGALGETASSGWQTVILDLDTPQAAGVVTFKTENTGDALFPSWAHIDAVEFLTTLLPENMPPTPQKIQNLVVTNDSLEYVTLTFSAPENAAHYAIRFSDSIILDFNWPYLPTSERVDYLVSGQSQLHAPRLAGNPETFVFKKTALNPIRTIGVRSENITGELSEIAVVQLPAF